MPSLHHLTHNKADGIRIDRQLMEVFHASNSINVCVLDTSGRVIGWNESAERMTGYSAGEMVGKSYASYTSKTKIGNHNLKKILQHAATEGEYSSEGIRERKDGTHFWARIYISPMKDKNGRLSFFVVMTRDISRDREKVQKRAEYIGIASHELRTPITTLSLYSELLGKRLELDHDKKNLHMLKDIQGQAARLSGLVDDLLLVDKVERNDLVLHRAVFRADHLIKKVVKDFQKNVTTHKILVKGMRLCSVRADEGRISQVLLNLLTNAVKFSPQADKVIVRMGTEKKTCTVSVQNFGALISKQEQKDIFTRFFRGDNAQAGNIGGSGLGLYISKEIIKKHRERMWVKSEVKKGTVFFFTLALSS